MSNQVPLRETQNFRPRLVFRSSGESTSASDDDAQSLIRESVLRMAVVGQTQHLTPMPVSDSNLTDDEDVFFLGPAQASTILVTNDHHNKENRNPIKVEQTAQSPPRPFPKGSQLDISSMLTHLNFPILWTGTLSIKKCQAKVVLHYIGGNRDLFARAHHPYIGSSTNLALNSRMPFDEVNLAAFQRKMLTGMVDERAILLALPHSDSKDFFDFWVQAGYLESAFGNYLREKNSAGIVRSYDAMFSYITHFITHGTGCLNPGIMDLGRILLYSAPKCGIISLLQHYSPLIVVVTSNLEHNFVL